MSVPFQPTAKPLDVRRMDPEQLRAARRMLSHQEGVVEAMRVYRLLSHLLGAPNTEAEAAAQWAMAIDNVAQRAPKAGA